MDIIAFHLFDAFVFLDLYTFDRWYCRIREGPSLQTRQVGTIEDGCTTLMSERVNNFLRLADGRGFVIMDFENGAITWEPVSDGTHPSNTAMATVAEDCGMSQNALSQQLGAAIHKSEGKTDFDIVFKSIMLLCFKQSPSHPPIARATPALALLIPKSRQRLSRLLMALIRHWPPRRWLCWIRLTTRFGARSSRPWRKTCYGDCLMACWRMLW